MRSVPRFDCASSSLTLSALLTKTTRTLWACLIAGLVAHLGLTQFGASQAEQRAPKPLTTHFVKRQPRLTKPLELKKRPQPKRRQVRREMVAVKAKAGRIRGAVGLQPARILGGLSKPDAGIERLGTSAGTDIGRRPALHSSSKSEPPSRE